MRVSVVFLSLAGNLASGMMDKTTTLARSRTLYTHMCIHAGVGYMWGEGGALSAHSKLHVHVNVVVGVYSTAQMGRQGYNIVWPRL